MTTTEILNEIHRLPLAEQKELKRKLFEEDNANTETEPKITQDEFDRILFEDGLLVNFPVEADEDDDFEPVEFTGKPISETIIEERR